MVGLVPIRGWPHRVTRASNDFCGRRRPQCCQAILRLVQGGWGEVFAVGVKLRQVGPIVFASGAYCIVKLPPVLYRGGGEKCLQLQASATRARCGPGGYIQVGMRGCDCGRGSARREVGPPFPCTHSCLEIILFAIQAPPSGGERCMWVPWGLAVPTPHVVGGAACTVGCVWSR